MEAPTLHYSDTLIAEGGSAHLRQLPSALDAAIQHTLSNRILPSTINDAAGPTSPLLVRRRFFDIFGEPQALPYYGSRVRAAPWPGLQLQEALRLLGPWASTFPAPSTPQPSPHSALG